MTLVRTIACALIFLVASCAYPITTVDQGAESASLYFTGAPPNARVLVDGADAGEAALFDGRRHVLVVSPGRHVVRVMLGDTELYANDIYAGAGVRQEVRLQ